MPDVEGPVTGGERTGDPQFSSVVDLDQFDYVEEEYFISEEARPLGEFQGRWFTSSEAYKTRVLVWRPRREEDFNGTCVIDWPNVTLQLDVPTIWINAYQHLVREGYAVAMVSTQKVGVDASLQGLDLVSWDPTRYGSLSHPGDRFSFDIASQAARALKARSRPDPDPLGGMRADTVLMGGLSQPSYLLQTYINNVQADVGIIDGFLPVAGAAEPIDVRDDLAPVLWMNTEDESVYVRPSEDSGQFKYWEVTGAAHINFWLSAYSAVAQARDYGQTVLGGSGYIPVDEFDTAFAGQYGQNADARYGDCVGDFFPMRYAYHTAIERLDEWATAGREPPSAPPIERDGFFGPVNDEYGNAVGGVRLPPVDVPLCHYDATAYCSFLGLGGQTSRLGDGALEALYPTQDAYLTQLDDAIDRATEDRFLLPADGEDLRQRAQNADIRN